MDSKVELDFRNSTNKNYFAVNNFRRNVEDYFSEILPTTVVGNSPSRKKYPNIIENAKNATDLTSNDKTQKDDNDRKSSFNVAGE